MNKNNPPLCPICEEEMYLNKHVEYNGDDDYGTDDFTWECVNECDPEVDIDGYGMITLEPITGESEIL